MRIAHVFALTLTVLSPLAAQTPAPVPPAARRVVRPPAYPARPPAEPAALERGKALYGVNCNFCHGSDARGGEGGPNLIRAELVLNDQNGELIEPVIKNGRIPQGMPKFDLTSAQISDIAAFIHNFKVGGYDISRMTPPSIVVGDEKEGKAYFNRTCGTCHSVAGDLKGFGAKFTDAKLLQNTYLMPGGGRGPRSGVTLHVPPVTVSVTLPSGEKAEGALVRVDDFLVTLMQADGTQRTFRRDGDVPGVEIHDPMKAHKELLPKYTDKDIHDLTAYLVTVK